MKTLILTITFFLFAVTQAFAIGQEWVSRYNGSGNSIDFSYAIALDPLNNIVVTGYSTGAATGKDLKTIKYDQSGNILWEATFNGPVNGGDYSNALFIDHLGNVYITGRADYGPSYSDIVTIKYSPDGVQQWLARFGGPGNYLDEGLKLTVDNSGNVFVTGKSVTSGTDFDIIVLKYNSAGALQWNAVYEGAANGDDYAVGIVLDNSGNIYVGGGSGGLTSGLDIIVVKFNPDGTQNWVKTYNGAGNGGDAVVSLKIDPSGNIVAAGYTDMGSVQKHNFITIKYDQSGNVLWMSQYNGSSNLLDVATDMTIDANSNIYVTGATTNYIGTRLDSNYVTLKYNPSGQLQWAVIYDGINSSLDISRSIHVDASSNVYISGSSKGAGTDDIVTIKYNPNGGLLWLMSYDGPGNQSDFSSSVVADNSGNAYVTGRSMGSGTDFDYATLKYSDLVGITPVSNNIPDKFNLYQNYPNPFNPQTKIKFDIAENADVFLTIYNSLGEIVSQVTFNNLAEGTYEYSLDISGKASGIYFYKINAGNFVSTKKMILLK